MMVQQNTVDKLRTIVLSVCILFSVSLFAQSEKTSEKSTIVMTKTELNSFLSTVAEARRSQLKERENRRVKQDLAELRLKHQQRSGIQTTGYEDISNQQLVRELRYLSQRIDNLSYNNNTLPSINRDNSTIILPNNVAPASLYPPNREISTTVVPSSNSKKIRELENRIDSLRNLKPQKDSYKNDAFADSLSTMKGRLTDVRRQMDSLELKMKTADKVKKDKPAVSKSYFKQQVYFENNSETLDDEYLQYIQDLTQILIKYPEAKVMLEGWASQSGTAKYNKQLSMRRAEAVENAFINNRIDKARIITSFRGEDQSSSAQHGRRVDMSIIVK
jgi:outer membrane protein OmpA-like peptidoglycan-associated protein